MEPLPSMKHTQAHQANDDRTRLTRALPIDCQLVEVDRED
jgi:hypothetical protein